MYRTNIRHAPLQLLVAGVWCQKQSDNIFACAYPFGNFYEVKIFKSKLIKAKGFKKLLFRSLEDFNMSNPGCNPGDTKVVPQKSGRLQCE